MKDYTLTFWETVKMRLYKRLGWAYRNKRLGFGFGRRKKAGIIYVPYLMEQTTPQLSEGEVRPKMLLKSKYAVSEIGCFPSKHYTSNGN